MKIDLEHLKRYKDIALLFIKYGRSDIIKQAGLEEAVADEEETSDATDEQKEEADDLAKDLENLGSTYIKLGQLLSTRADLLPPAHLEALARLQDDVEPFSYEEVDQIVSNEIGVRISKAFAEFVEKLPHRVNNILDIIGNNELEVKVDAIDEKTLMVSFKRLPTVSRWVWS